MDANSARRLPILKIPLSFYGLSADPHATKNPNALDLLNSYVNDLTRDLRVQIEAVKLTNAQFPSDLYRAVKTMPAALFRLPDECEIPISLFTILHEHVYYVYSAYQVAPDNNLAGLLNGYPEYAYYLLKDENVGPTPNESQEIRIRSLYDNPFWAIKWFEHHYADNQFSAMLGHIYGLRENEAYGAHCYHWLKTRTATPEVKLEELTKVLGAFGSNPYIAIVTAMEYPDIDVEPLLTDIKSSPMWTYNWLRLVKRPPSPHLVQTLLEWVPWAIQYIHDMNPADAPELIEQIKLKPKNQYWDPWLDRYLATRK